MSATAVATRLDAVDAESFLDLARAYGRKSGKSRIVKAIVDALAASNNPEDDVLESFQIIADLEHVVENGTSYTPAAELGFGSDNAATIAARILGRGMSKSEARRQFVKTGE